MMSTGKRSIWTLAMIAFLITTSGCARSNLRLVEEEIMRDGTGLREESGQEINGYVLHNGTKKNYQGYARLAGQDTLAFWSKKQVRHKYTGVTMSSSRVPGPVYSVVEVESLDVVTYGVTAGAVVGVVLVAGAIALVLVASSLSASFDH